jgi:hypothetical protein
MFEEPRGITTQHTTSYMAVMHRLAQGSREVTLSSDKDTLSDIAAHGTKEGVKGGKEVQAAPSRDHDHN